MSGTPSPRLGLVRGVLLATLAQVTLNTASLAWTPGAVASGVRGQQVVHDLGEHLAAALAIVGLVALWRKFGSRRPWHGWLVLAAALVLLAIPTVGEDAAGFVARFESDVVARLLGVVVVVAVALAVCIAALIGDRLTERRGVAGVAVVVGLGVLAGNHAVLRDGYPAAHLFLALCGGALTATALASLPLPRWWPRMLAGFPWAVAAALAVFAVVSPPSNTVQLEMLKVEGSVIAPYLTRLRSERAAAGGAQVPSAWTPWFTRRDAAPAVPPSGPKPADDLVVVLLTIDSWRADVPLDRDHDRRFPNLARLRDQSLYFTAARAPGSQTVYSLTELFAGTYFSQQYWSELADQRDRWPDDDETPRFPELLAAAGVPTVTYASTKWLVNRNGVVRGFTEEEVVPPRPGCFYGTTDQQMPRILERLDAVGRGPAFVYAHILDPHFNLCPLAVGPPRTFAAYLQALEPVDAQIGALRARLDQPDLAGRAVLIVSADHGEAFGEHGAHNHRHNLYEELLRVPLMIYGQRFAPRRIDAPVSLIDLGPTILDLFGQATPGRVLGQSLVPLLRGDGAAPTRPIVAEGQLKKAMIFPDGFKAIVDDRNYTLEVYDLNTDPQESNNLIDSGDPSAFARIDLLRRFFRVHRIERPGYAVPYRP